MPKSLDAVEVELRGFVALWFEKDRKEGTSDKRP